jgi:hypothetical protein
MSRRRKTRADRRGQPIHPPPARRFRLLPAPLSLSLSLSLSLAITEHSPSIDSSPPPPAPAATARPSTTTINIMQQQQQTTTTTTTQLQTTTPRRMRQQEEAAAKATEDSRRFLFDAGKPPPFRIGDVRAAVPPHCWRKSPLRSLSYVARDVAVVAVLAMAAAALDSWALWPIYWAAQGTMFWALFVLGHDWLVFLACLLSRSKSWNCIYKYVSMHACSGHGSFSDSATLNSAVGHLLHSFILVPYHGWYAGSIFHPSFILGTR